MAVLTGTVDLAETVSLAWGVASRPVPGETVSGDAHVARPTATGATLAVIDGLGHGPDAAVAGSAGAQVISDHAHKEPAVILGLAHRALRHSRGAAITVATVDGRSGSVTWAGVGNVEGILRCGAAGGGETRHEAPLAAGIVGDRMPTLRPRTISIGPGDLLVLASDGVRLLDIDWRGHPPSPEYLAKHFLADCSLPSDDALVLVARLELRR